MDLIREDRHDLIVLYNGNYDHWMHRGGPETPWALRALRENINTYCVLQHAIREHCPATTPLSPLPRTTAATVSTAFWGSTE